MESPCETCTKCKHTALCGNIYCEDWRSWFIKAWEEACERLRAGKGERG